MVGRTTIHQKISRYERYRVPLPQPDAVGCHGCYVWLNYIKAERLPALYICRSSLLRFTAPSSKDGDLQGIKVKIHSLTTHTHTLTCTHAHIHVHSNHILYLCLLYGAHIYHNYYIPPTMYYYSDSIGNDDFMTFFVQVLSLSSGAGYQD